MEGDTIGYRQNHPATLGPVFRSHVWTLGIRDRGHCRHIVSCNFHLILDCSYCVLDELPHRLDDRDRDSGVTAGPMDSDGLRQLLDVFQWS